MSTHSKQEKSNKKNWGTPISKLTQWAVCSPSSSWWRWGNCPNKTSQNGLKNDSRNDHVGEIPYCQHIQWEVQWMYNNSIWGDLWKSCYSWSQTVVSHPLRITHQSHHSGGTPVLIHNVLCHSLETHHCPWLSFSSWGSDLAASWVSTSSSWSSSPPGRCRCLCCRCSPSRSWHCFCWNYSHWTQSLAGLFCVWLHLDSWRAGGRSSHTGGRSCDLWGKSSLSIS